MMKLATDTTARQMAWRIELTSAQIHQRLDVCELERLTYTGTHANVDEGPDVKAQGDQSGE